MITGSVHGNGGINGLQQGSGVYTGNEEAGFVQSVKSKLFFNNFQKS